MFSLKEKIQKELKEIDIEINGTRPWDIQLWQIIYTKHGSSGGYTSVR